MIKRFLAGLMMAGLLVGGVSTASAAAFVEGKNYVRLDKPLPTRDKTRIEVIEFFWYGCIHCFHFEPTLKAWASKQADDVYLQGSPALWNKAMSLHAQAFYTAQALGGRRWRVQPNAPLATLKDLRRGTARPGEPSR